MIAKGYKQTEVGVIPEDWIVSTVGDNCKIFGRIGFRGYTVNDIVKQGQGAVTLSPSNIKKNKLTLKNVAYLSWFKYNESPEIKIYNGDILLVKTGSTYGKTCFVENLNSKATLNPQVVVLKKTRCNNKYLSFLMATPLIQNQVISSVVGGAIPTLSQEQIKSFQIPLPPTLKEQQAIAKVLTDTDNLIQGIEDLIAKKKATKKGAMQQLLTSPNKGGKRLPDFSGEWIETELQSLCNIYGGGTPSTSVSGYWNGNIEWFTPTEIGKKKYVSNSKRKITQLGLKSSSANILPVGTVLMTSRASIGDFAILTKEASTNQGFQSLIPKKSADTEFVYQLMSTKKKELLNLSSGSTFLEISPNKIKTLTIEIPNEIIEREAIATILSDMDKEIEALEVKKEKYIQVKKGLAQELLTGKTRLV